MNTQEVYSDVDARRGDSQVRLERRNEDADMDDEDEVSDDEEETMSGEEGSQTDLVEWRFVYG